MKSVLLIFSFPLILIICCNNTNKDERKEFLASQVLN
jgi:hypothetical protein